MVAQDMALRVCSGGARGGVYLGQTLLDAAPAHAEAELEWLSAHSFHTPSAILERQSIDQRHCFRRKLSDA